MSIEEIFQTLDTMLADNKIDKIESYLLQCREQAKETDDYGIYIAIANEMLNFYKSTMQYRKAFDVAEDVLLLMEELQMEDTEQFATMLLNTATVYQSGGLVKESYPYYRRALLIYESVTKRFTQEELEQVAMYYSMALTGVGEACYHMGEYEEALQYYEKALGIVKKFFGENQTYALVCDNCATVCAALQDMQKQQYYKNLSDTFVQN
ncbi:MAG: tetratricopeptide repeat protein [Lachnospiraceae bacterium]|nr:tetratricopeptide repeat protein [Lachnospiraceae bacterium]